MWNRELSIILEKHVRPKAGMMRKQRIQAAIRWLSNEGLFEQGRLVAGSKSICILPPRALFGCEPH
jgi:hypothetical protein